MESHRHLIYFLEILLNANGMLISWKQAGWLYLFWILGCKCLISSINHHSSIISSCCFSIVYSVVILKRGAFMCHCVRISFSLPFLWPDWFDEWFQILLLLFSPLCCVCHILSSRWWIKVFFIVRDIPSWDWDGKWS